MVADGDQSATAVAGIDAACSVGHYNSLDSHAGEDTNRKGDLLCGIAFVKMDAALHSSDGDACQVADHEISGVTDGGAARESGNLDVGYADSMMELVGEPAEAGAEDESDACAKWRARQNGLRGVFGVEEFVEVDQGVVRQQQSSRIATNIFTTEGTEDTEKTQVA